MNPRKIPPPQIKNPIINEFFTHIPPQPTNSPLHFQSYAVADALKSVPTVRPQGIHRADTGRTQGGHKAATKRPQSVHRAPIM